MNITRVSFDIDGVLLPLQEYIVRKGNSYFNTVPDLSKIEVEQMYNCSKEEASKFWRQNIFEYTRQEPINERFLVVLKELAKRSDIELYCITRRAHTTEKGIKGIIFRKDVEAMFKTLKKEHNIFFKGIRYCTALGGTYDKAKACEDLNIDVHIDDETENINALQKVTKVIGFKQQYNQDVKTIGDLTMINDPMDMLDIVEEIVKEKKNIKIEEQNKTKKQTRDPYHFSYNAVRIPGVAAFKLAFKPTIINKEYIPKEGAIILCGNHLHVLDQYPVICATKRVTHWMAKQEYFTDGSLQGRLFKWTGAIPTDRKGDTQKAVSISEEYLKDGLALGLFPEGTRNKVTEAHLEQLQQYDFVTKNISKEELETLMKTQKCPASRLLLLDKLYQEKRVSEQDYVEGLFQVEKTLQQYQDKGIITSQEHDDSLLLPFKSGAYNMAKNCDATIIPFAVTGNWSTKKNIVVRFDQGFKVNDFSHREGVAHIRGKVLNLVKKNIEK